MFDDSLVLVFLIQLDLVKSLIIEQTAARGIITSFDIGFSLSQLCSISSGFGMRAFVLHLWIKRDRVFLLLTSISARLERENSTLCIAATSLVFATLAYFLAVEIAASCGPIIGHLIALTVRDDAWPVAGQAVVARVRSDPGVECPRKGHTAENRKRELTCIAR
jgi:hypothetical protein